MLKRFIDTTVRRNVWRLFSEEYNVSRDWGTKAVDSLGENYHDDGLNLKRYKVSKIKFEIITKLYMLSVIRLSKKEIIQNLKKRYKEKDIMDAIRFLEEKGLLKEYLEIPHYQNTVVVEISKWGLKNKKSTKFYNAHLNFSRNIAMIGSKKSAKNHSHCLYVSDNSLSFMDVPKDEWDIDIIPNEMLGIKIHNDIFNKFISKNCVVESSLSLLLARGDEKEVVWCDDEEIINHSDREMIKEKLLNRFLGKVKKLCGKNIVVKDVNPTGINVKYMLPKNILLPIVLLIKPVMSSPLFPYSIDPRNPYKYVKKDKNKRDIWWLGGSYIIRNKKKNENNDYFFIDNESEDFDDIVIGIPMAQFEYIFPDNRQKEFIGYLTKKLKKAGINKIEICYN